MLWHDRVADMGSIAVRRDTESVAMSFQLMI